MNDLLRVAVVGNFQRGKSTLVNCLLGRLAAETGVGISTTHRNASFRFGSCEIVDTPGFDANGGDDEEASRAIREADVFVVVHESGALGSTRESLIQTIRTTAKPFLFLLNCKNRDKWNPDDNSDVIETIRAQLETMGILSNCIPIEGKPVFPINILWAWFGIGQLTEEHETRRIRRYADDEISLPNDIVDSESALRAEMLQRSGFLPVRDFLKNLPLELLKHTVSNPQREIDRIVDRFAAELKKRWSAA